MTKYSDDLVAQAEPFILRLARSFEQRGLVGEHKAVTREDLIQVGRVATWRASLKYDPTRGAKFFTYAFPAIWQAITAEVHRMGDTVKLPAAFHWDVIRHVARAIEEMTNELGRHPTLDEVQGNLTLVNQLTPKSRSKSGDINELKDLRGNISIKEDIRVKGIIREAWIYLEGNREVSLTQDWEEEGGLEEYENTPGNFDLEFLVEEDAFRDRIADAMTQVLTTRERDILRLRMGFEDGRPRTFREAATELGLSPEGARQIEAVALEKLRRDPRGRTLRRI